MSFWDDLTGKTASEASKAAAADTYAKQKAATGELKSYGDEYAGKFADLSKGYDPYVGAGNTALSRLMSGLGLGGDSRSFTEAYRATPGYQAALDKGTNNITTNAAAHGMLKSGGALKALQTYGQNYEDTKSGDYLNRLAGVAGSGQQATGQQIGVVGQGLQGQLGTRQTAYGGDFSSAGTIGQGDIAAANARAAGSQNLLNTGIKLGGMALGAAGGFGGMPGMGASGSSYLGSMFSPSGSNPFNPDGSRNTMAYGNG